MEDLEIVFLEGLYGIEFFSLIFCLYKDSHAYVVCLS